MARFTRERERERERGKERQREEKALLLLLLVFFSFILSILHGIEKYRALSLAFIQLLEAMKKKLHDLLHGKHHKGTNAP